MGGVNFCGGCYCGVGGFDYLCILVMWRSGAARAFVAQHFFVNRAVSGMRPRSAFSLTHHLLDNYEKETSFNSVDLCGRACPDGGAAASGRQRRRGLPEPRQTAV